MVEFLIHLERLGLNVDPTPLVDRLLTQIKQLPAMSRSELSVLWFPRTHHKMVPIGLTAPEFALDKAGGRLEEFKTAAGYKVGAHLVGDEVDFLEVRAPRHRYRAEPELTTCEVCNYEWMKGDPESSLLHRREHKKRLTVLQPSPDPRFLEALANDAEPELVTSASPKWKHHAVYMRAATFRREFHYDFVQWDGPHRVDEDPKAHGFLFNDDSGVFGHGAIAGACAFRWREYRDHPPSWAMQWIWIAPKARRRGILSRRWDAFRARFGKFAIEPPTERGNASVRRQTRRRRSGGAMTASMTELPRAVHRGPNRREKAGPARESCSPERSESTKEVGRAAGQRGREVCDVS
jgi:hypothetical protein